MEKNFIDQLIARVEKDKGNKDKHVPYEQVHGRPPEVVVEYVLDKSSELEDTKPTQGMRCNFLYDGDDLLKDGAYSIAPEILDENEDVIIDKNKLIPVRGRAYMWLASDANLEKVHKIRMKSGVRGYWYVGPYKLAEVVIIKGF